MSFVKVGKPVKTEILEVKKADKDIERDGKIVKAGKKYLDSAEKK